MKINSISVKFGAILALVALACTAVSVGIFSLTASKINATMDEQQRLLLQQVMPDQYKDNNLLVSYDTPKDPALAKQLQKIYFAMKDGKLSAYAFETTAPDGYSGNIRLLIGITPDGEILGVRVLEHHETPGLGDKIDLRISNWILAFTNQFIRNDNLNEWAVKKDGGKFDQFSGATITPRAIVNQVKRSAILLLQNKDKISCERATCYYGKGEQ